MSYLSFDSLVVSDREVVDMLESQKQRVSKAKMVDYLRQRGIICSINDSREVLAEYISSLNIDWHLIEDILSLAQSNENQQKVTAQTIKLTDINALTSTLNEMEELYNNKSFTISGSKNSYEIDYSNEFIEKNNTRLIQRKSKDEKINIKVQGDEVTIINTVGEGTEPVIQRLIHQLEKNTKSTIEKKVIDFSNIYSNEIINNFFLKLIELNGTYIRDDVIKIKFNKFNSNESEEFDIEDEDLEAVFDSHAELSLDDELVELHDDVPDLLNNSLGDIKSALLSGSSLLTSEFFTKFTDQGYFISHIRWKFREKNQEPKTFEFSASFDQPDLRKTFIFEANKYYKYDKATGLAQKTSQKWKGNEKNQIELKLHKIALALYDQIIEDSSGG